jgi:phosphohistidine phosphatase
MRLMLLRHAKTEKAPSGTRDRDRTLTPRGLHDTPLIGAYMARHQLRPDRVIVSPAARTRQTWEHLAGLLAAKPPVEYDDRIYENTTAGILAVIKDCGAGAAALLMIGHNPSFHETAQRLIASGEIEARERLNEGLPTAGLVVIDFAGDDWKSLHLRSGRLDRFVTPRSLAAATD